MNFRLLSHTMGYILWVEAGFLLLPALTACIYAETCWQQFLLTALLCAAGTPPELGQERTAPSLYDFVEQVLRGKEGEEKR